MQVRVTQVNYVGPTGGLLIAGEQCAFTIAKRMLRLFIAITAAAWLAGISGAVAANITSVDSKDGKTRLNLVGEIQPGDLEAVQTAIKTANDKNRLVVTLRLASIGGNVLEAVKIADVVRHGKIATAVLSGATCASACFIIFAAGNEKYAHYTATIGVHGASDSSGKETVESGAATISMARIVRELGVPASIIGKMVVTPPDQMVWLGPDDLRSMGAAMLGKPEQLATEQSQQQHPAQLPTPILPDAQASTGPTWGDLVKRAIDASTAQNGKPNVSRICQPELKACSIAVFYKTKNGVNGMVRTAEDLNGKVFKRDICTFNNFDDIRTCLDFDSGKKTREMRASNGIWTEVEAE